MFDSAQVSFVARRYHCCHWSQYTPWEGGGGGRGPPPPAGADMSPGVRGGGGGGRDPPSPAEADMTHEVMGVELGGKEEGGGS